MARPKKTDTLDTAQAIELTAGAIQRLTCRTDTKAQAFLRDTKAPGLRVRVTNTGHKSYVYETKLNRQTIRRTIGDVRAWTIEQARTEARRLAVLVDEGVNPIDQERQQQAEREAKKAAAAALAVTVGEAWAAYIAERRPHWGERHYLDHVAIARPGGEPVKRGTGVIQPGPLAAFMRPLDLLRLHHEKFEAWILEQAGVTFDAAKEPGRLRAVTP